ncbi:hypothetical protein BDN70DRAFT_885513 [Pholiota conissans]|uniref:F-box domain-containing protein n=1 Tax=Pholiota conissans TaxID=109636 RepID=A0A9P5YQX5_9AGAR|nr:hypothetical protein BDN70DRAFT_885513 [Pholiota conissans]
MNNPPGGNEENREVNVFLQRQQRILKAVKEELHASHEKLKQTLRQHDDIFYRLFPPVRPGRDTVLIDSSIKESRKKLAGLRQAILDQRIELESLEIHPSSSSPGAAGSSKEHYLADRHDKEGEDHEDVDALISDGRNNLAKLKKEFVETRAHLDKLEALLSPIRLLPVEVLGEIFNHCMDPTTLDPMSSNSGPFLVTHVCSAWRSIAISKSDLWTNIWVTIENDEDKSGWPAFVKLWVERSGELPLKFHIQENDTHNYTQRPQSVFFRVLDILAPQAHRWKNAGLLNRNFQATGNTQWFGKLPEMPFFPLLESFTLQTRRMELQEVARVTEMIRRSPRLHEVTWMIKTATTMPTLPWAQLTRLTLIFICSLDMTLDILENSPHLRELDISVQLSEDAQSIRHVTHPNLKSIYFSCAGTLTPLFESLTLPKVTDVTIDQMPDVNMPEVANRPWPHATFMEFLKRSKCALKKFAMMDVLVADDSELIDLLCHLSPTLKVLLIENEDHPCITDNVLHALSFPSYASRVQEDGSVNTEGLGDILCPQLRELKLWGCMSSSDGVLADMVESRWGWPDAKGSALRKLKKCDFGVTSPPTKPLDQERLKSLNSHKIKYMVLDTY